MGESSNAVGLMPGGMVRRGDRPVAGEGEEPKGLPSNVTNVSVLKRAVLILAALELKPLLSAMLLLPPKPGKLPPLLESQTIIPSLPLLLSLMLLLLFLFSSISNEN